MLQGDCLSECVKSNKGKCMEYMYCYGILLRHWFQFADNTAIISALNKDN